MYEDQTKAVILERMLANSPADIDQRQGSVTHDLLSPPAIELSQAYADLDNVLNYGFTDTANDGYLDRRAADYGLTRKPAVKSAGVLTFTGAEGTFIPKGTIASTGGENAVYFVTVADVTLVGSGVIVMADAETAGASGNVGIGAINTLIGDLVGVVNVSNTSNFIGGVDVESNEALRSRYYERASRAVTSGNANHYRQWALEVPGVSDAIVYPVWNGPGTVKVVLLGDDKTAPDSAVVASAQSYIDPTQDGRGEGAAPVGPIVTVLGATEKVINVTADIELASGATVDQVRLLVENGVRAYLKTLAFNDPIVRINQIGNVLIDIPPVLDYTGLKLNGSSGNLETVQGEVAVLGTVSFT